MTIPDEILDLDLVKIGMYIYIKRKCGKAGECDVVIEPVTSLQYPKNVVVTFRGAQVNLVNQLGNGDAVGCDISIDAREWQGRWFNAVTGYNLKKL